jgi:hypothetical protein
MNFDPRRMMKKRRMIDDDDHDENVVGEIPELVNEL